MQTILISSISFLNMVCNGCFNQCAAVIGNFKRNPFRQSFLYLLHFCFYCFNYLVSILAISLTIYRQLLPFPHFHQKCRAADLHPFVQSQCLLPLQGCHCYCPRQCFLHLLYFLYNPSPRMM